MELIYLWSNQIGLLENQGVNFSSRYWVEVAEADENSRPTRLTIAKRDGLAGEFFNLEGKKDWPLLEVTGLVGENGAGKTSVLRRIFRFVHLDPPLKDEIDTIYLFLKEGDSKPFLCFSPIPLLVSFLGENSEDDRSDCVEIDLAKIGNWGDRGKVFENFCPHVALITHFFSGQRDTGFAYSNTQFKKAPGAINFSTDELLKKNEGKALYPFDQFATEEIRRIYDAILSGAIKEIPRFEPPRKLFLGISRNQKAFSEKASDDYIKTFGSLIESLAGNQKLKNKHPQFLYAALFFLSYLRHCAIENSYANIVSQSMDFFKKLATKLNDIVKDTEEIEIVKGFKEQISKEAISELIPEAYRHGNSGDIIGDQNFQKIKDSMANGKEMVDHLAGMEESFFESFSRIYFKESQPRRWQGRVEVDRSSKETVVELFDMILNSSKNGIPFPIRFDWEGNLSSGEMAFLSLFGRLKGVQKELESFDSDKLNLKPLNCDREETQWSGRPLLILLDEPDILMHPKWQQKLIDWLVQALPVIFPGRKLQLILTSHSPFVCADLPRNHLVFLRRTENQDGSGDRFAAKVVPSGEMESTFGANVHKIFTNTQFLGKNLLGEFARRKIGNLIKQVNDFSGDPTLYRALRTQIEEIGEDFIRRKLLHQLEEKNRPRLDHLEEEMKDLQQRMKSVEEKIEAARKEEEDGQD